MDPALDIFPVFLPGVFYGTYFFYDGFVGSAYHILVEIVFQPEGLGHQFSQQVFLVSLFQDVFYMMKIAVSAEVFREEPYGEDYKPGKQDDTAAGGGIICGM